MAARKQHAAAVSFLVDAGADVDRAHANATHWEDRSALTALLPFRRPLSLSSLHLHIRSNPLEGVCVLCVTVLCLCVCVSISLSLSLSLRERVSECVSGCVTECLCLCVCVTCVYLWFRVSGGLHAVDVSFRPFFIPSVLRSAIPTLHSACSIHACGPSCYDDALPSMRQRCPMRLRASNPCLLLPLPPRPSLTPRMRCLEPTKASRRRPSCQSIVSSIVPPVLSSMAGLALMRSAAASARLLVAADAAPESTPENPGSPLADTEGVPQTLHSPPGGGPRGDVPAPVVPTGPSGLPSTTKAVVGARDGDRNGRDVAGGARSLWPVLGVAKGGSADSAAAAASASAAIVAAAGAWQCRKCPSFKALCSTQSSQPCA